MHSCYLYTVRDHLVKQLLEAKKGGTKTDGVNNQPELELI